MSPSELPPNERPSVLPDLLAELMGAWDASYPEAEDSPSVAAAAPLEPEAPPAVAETIPDPEPVEPVALAPDPAPVHQESFADTPLNDLLASLLAGYEEADAEAAAAEPEPAKPEEPEAPNEPDNRPALEALLAAIEAEMAGAPVETVARPQDQLGKRYVTLSLGDRRFALPFDSIVEADRVPPITFVPGLPPFVRGVSNVRSEIVPMIDLARLLELPHAGRPSHQRMLLAKTSGLDRPAGFVFDTLGGLVTLDEAQIEPPPRIADDAAIAMLSGVARAVIQRGGRVSPGLVEILDLDRLARKAGFENATESLVGPAAPGRTSGEPLYTRS